MSVGASEPLQCSSTRSRSAASIRDTDATACSGVRASARAARSNVDATRRAVDAVTCDPSAYRRPDTPPLPSSPSTASSAAFASYPSPPIRSNVNSPPSPCTSTASGDAAYVP